MFKCCCCCLKTSMRRASAFVSGLWFSFRMTKVASACCFRLHRMDGAHTTPHHTTQHKHIEHRTQRKTSTEEATTHVLFCFVLARVLKGKKVINKKGPSEVTLQRSLFFCCCCLFSTFVRCVFNHSLSWLETLAHIFSPFNNNDNNNKRWLKCKQCIVFILKLALRLPSSSSNCAIVNVCPIWSLIFRHTCRNPYQKHQRELNIVSQPSSAKSLLNKQNKQWSHGLCKLDCTLSFSISILGQYMDKVYLFSQLTTGDCCADVRVCCYAFYCPCW